MTREAVRVVIEKARKEMDEEELARFLMEESHRLREDVGVYEKS